MTTILRQGIVLLAAAVIAGCAGLEFYTSPEMTKGTEAGIKFYIPKPYLLVGRTGAKDKPVDISVVYLPDMAKPLYARAKSGYGTAKLTMAFTNGMLSSFGQETDTKIPETLTALGGFGKAVAEARKINREALAMELQSGIDYVKLSGSLKAASADLRAVAVPRSVGVDGLTNGEIQTLASFTSILDLAAAALGDPAGAERSAPGVAITLKQMLQTWKQIGEPPAGVSQPVRQRILGARNQVAAVLEAITPKAPEEAAFTLYEIDNSSGSTRLIEVKF